MAGMGLDCANRLAADVNRRNTRGRERRQNFMARTPCRISKRPGFLPAKRGKSIAGRHPAATASLIILLQVRNPLEYPYAPLARFASTASSTGSILAVKWRRNGAS